MRKGGKKGCQCKDGTYSKDCCDGQSQGVGSTQQQTISNDEIRAYTIFVFLCSLLKI